jgi:ABC-type multidrug transport system fused ATPase/permease subunit
VGIPFREYWELLARHIRPQRGRFLLLTVLLLGSIGLQLLVPQVVSRFIDATGVGEAERTLLLMALGFIGLALFQQVVAVAATYVGENVAWTATNALRGELARHCLGLDMAFHNDTTPGQLIERIDGDVGQLADFFSQIVVRVLGNLLLMLGILVVLFFEDWRVGVGFTVFVVFVLLILNRVRGLAVPHQKAKRQASAELFGFLEEQLAGTEDIRSSGGVGFVLDRLYRLQYGWMRYDYKAWLMDAAIGVVSGAALILGNVGAVLGGYHLYVGGAVTLGGVYLIVQYLELLIRPFHELAHHVESLQTVGASIERLADLRALKCTVQDGSTESFPEGPLSLDFDRVSFSYSPEEPALIDLSFSLAAGRVLGLLGRTGSGKTTVARLAFRLYDATVGSIRLNGVDTRSVRLGALRQCLAYVTQDVQLFRASLRDNLTFFDRSISDEHILNALEALELGDWYRALPDGLDTALAAGGRNLSAGEAQLLALTRVFLRDPALVVLDEASSRLDPATERRIERAIDRLIKDRTAIIIAHRLPTVKRADEILILDNGRLVEHGERQPLARDSSSRFHQLLQTGLEEVLA